MTVRPGQLPAPLQDALRDRYALERELGSGGMATVYLAEDLKHHRKVALKVLRPELAATLGPERFLQEIETAARFQHPHILPLLDSGEAGGFLYYAMPYVEGESLRGRLARKGELPVHDAVKILIEVCDALAYAHARGVVHRDIKPDNVLLSGRHALVTDFGIAKALSEATGRQQLTTAGVALGTPAYMAPEQAAAEPSIDHRVDIYALGALAYELIAGTPPFTGRTSQEILAAHMTQKPEPLCARRPACPPGLEAVVMRCLEKRPADRWQSADELLAQLEPLATPSGGITPTTTRPMEAVSPLPRPGSVIRWVLAAALLLVLGAAAALAFHRSPPEMRLGRRMQLTHDPGLEIEPALSPDGRFVAYVAGPLGHTRLYVRQVDGGAPVAITPNQAGFARRPRWSPDGSRLVFRSERGLEVVPALGGASRLLVSSRPDDYINAFWSSDGGSIDYEVGDSVLARPVDGGVARGVARLAEVHSCASSTNGSRLACVSGNRNFIGTRSYGNIAASSIWVIPMSGGAPARVTDDRSLNVSPVWLAGRSSLLYVSNRDGGRDIYQFSLTHAGQPAAEPVRLTTGLNAAQISTSADGRRLAYAAFVENSNVWSLPIPTAGVASVGRAEPVTAGTQVIENFSVSPDGSWLAFDSDRGGTQQIYRIPIAGGEPELLTTGSEPAFRPVISPDGREIAYHSFRLGTRQIFLIQAEGGAPTQVTTEREGARAPMWRPDGRALSFIAGQATSSAQTIEVVTRNASGRWSSPRVLREHSIGALWSPDGRSYLMSTATEGGRRLPIVIGSTAGAEDRVLVPARDPLTDVTLLALAWSDDGQLVYYQAYDPKDRSIGIWRIPAAGGSPRLLVRFDDPSRPYHREGFRVHGGRFYFTLGEQQSDIWVADMTSSR